MMRLARVRLGDVQLLWRISGGTAMLLAERLIGSPLVTVLFTKGMIAADFLGDRTGIRIGHVLPNGPQQEAVGLFFLAALGEPIGSPLVRLLLTKGMIARGFSGRPDGYSGWTCPPKRTDSRKLWAFSFGCNSAQAAVTS